MCSKKEPKSLVARECWTRRWTLKVTHAQRISFTTVLYSHRTPSHKDKGPAKTHLTLGDFVLCRPCDGHHLPVWLGRTISTVELFASSNYGTFVVEWWTPMCSKKEPKSLVARECWTRRWTLKVTHAQRISFTTVLYSHRTSSHKDKGPAKTHLTLGDFVLCRPCDGHHLPVWLGRTISTVELFASSNYGTFVVEWWTPMCSKKEPKSLVARECWTRQWIPKVTHAQRISVTTVLYSH